MNKNELILQSDNENSILPFLGMQIFDAKIPMDISIRRSKNIINRETFKLVDEFKMLNLKKQYLKQMNIRSKTEHTLNPNKDSNKFNDNSFSKRTRVQSCICNWYGRRYFSTYKLINGEFRNRRRKKTMLCCYYKS